MKFGEKQNSPTRTQHGHWLELLFRTKKKVKTRTVPLHLQATGESKALVPIRGGTCQKENSVSDMVVFPGFGLYRTPTN